MTGQNPPLELIGASLTYLGPPRVDALRNIDFRVEWGDFVAVVGPSGSGKSSLLHVLGLLSTPTEGSVRLDGNAIEDSNDSELTRSRGRGIGFVFQAFYLLESRSAVENVSLPLRYQGLPAGEAQRKAEEALKKVGLGHRIDASAKTLSGGERQRVAIARALVTDPAVLLCDEPTGNLDSGNSANVMNLLRELNAEGRTVVLVTHDEKIAAESPRSIRLLDGRVTSDSGVAARPTTLSALPGSSARGTSGRMGWLDLIDEALAGLMERGWRTTLTCLGTVLGVTTLVVTLGLASTASTQVSRQFDRLVATTVTATSLSPSAYLPAQLARASGLNGVEGLAYLQPVSGARVEQSPTSPEAVATGSLPVIGATPGSWRVVVPTMLWGRTFDSTLDGRRVAVLGSAAARQAGIYGPIGTQSVMISGHPYLVLGVFDDVQRRTDLLLSVVVPIRTAISDFGTQVPVQSTEVVLATAVGAGRQVANELPLALTPENPDAVDVIPPPDPRQLRDDVTSDLTGLFVTLALVTVFVSMVGIANTSLVAVMERVPEIGLRRALGAQRRSILAQFLTESTLIGAAGGIIGSLMGLIIIVAVALSQQWTPVLPREIILLAPVGGALVGVVAGLMPARRASHTDPTSALRR